MEPTSGGPIVRRVQLGARLRGLREAAGVSRADAGWAIRGSESKISRMELGRVGFKERDVVDLLKLYRFTDDLESARLIELARQANSPGWWSPYSDVMDDWLHNYVDLEGAAELIRCYQVQFVPDLLQTKNYARAIITLSRGNGGADIGRRTELRMRRQQIFDRDDPPRLWTVVDEAVLHRPFGQKRILREQIEALQHACQRPEVRLQILPFEVGGHSAVGGAFNILRFPHPELPDVVQIEHLTSGLYLERPSDVDTYTAAFGDLIIEAESPDRTADRLQTVLDNLGA